MIQLKSYSISQNITLTSQVLETYINNFWEDIFKSIKDSHLMIMCKVQFTDESMGYKTLGHLVKTNYEDKDLFIEYLSLRLSVLNESYMVHPVSNIIFSYVIKSGKNTETNRTLLHQEVKNTNHNFNNMVLPVSMNPADYGEIRADTYVQVDSESIHRYIVKNGNRTYEIDISSDGLTNKVTILGAINLSWVDTKILDDVFMRVIKKSTIYFMDGQVVLRKQILNAKPFKSLKLDTNRTGNYFTMDIETIKNNNGKLSPYLICAYNGSDYITSSPPGVVVIKKLYSHFSRINYYQK